MFLSCHIYRILKLHYCYSENKRKDGKPAVVTGFRAGYHHVKVDGKNKNTLLIIHCWKYITERQEIQMLLVIKYMKYLRGAVCTAHA